MDLRLHNYNNFITFAFSYCKTDDCGKNTDIYYSSFMIFSYSNSTDINFDLYQYLLDNYNSTINDFSINLEDYVKIENNIFGYIFNGILIKEIINCYNLQLFSSISNKTIYSNYTLDKNETIKINFIENNFSSFNCNLHYSYIITEPNLQDYDEYPEYIG